MASLTPLRRVGSGDTLRSMHQIDPRPMESEKNLEGDLDTQAAGMANPPSFSSSTIKSRGTTSSLGLSGGGHGAIYYLSRVQRYSSYTFTFFAGLHLANTSLIPLVYRSVPYSEPFLLMARELYQTPVTEPLLVGLPLVAHVTSGLGLRLLRRHQALERYGGAGSSSAWPAVSNIAISGYVFAGLLASHVGMNRVLPLMAEGDSSNIGLQYVSHGFARKGFPPWVAFSLLLSVGVGHMVWGWAKWMGITPPINWSRSTVDKQVLRRRRRAYWGINAAAAALTGLWAAGGLGIVARAGLAEGWLGKVYDGIYNYRP